MVSSLRGLGNLFPGGGGAMALPSPFVLSLFPSRTAPASPILEPTPTELARYGAGTLILPPGVETPEGLPNPLGGATLLGPDGVPIFMSQDDSAGLGGLVQHPSAGADVASSTPPHGTHTMGALPVVARPQRTPTPTPTKILSAEGYWAIMTQGGPNALAAAADFCRAMGSTAGLRAAGTFADEPLGTQDPESWTSWLNRVMLPNSAYWETDRLSPALKEELDQRAAAFGTAYGVGKILTYNVRLAANFASASKIAADETLSGPEQARLLAINHHDMVGNVAFLLEKLCYPLIAGEIAMAHIANRESALWDIGYWLSAVTINGALALATWAWVEKILWGKMVLENERARFLEAQGNGKIHNLRVQNFNSALFNMANAAPRIIKHFVIHLAALGLTASFVLPDLFGGLQEKEYFRGVLDKLGEGTPAELAYRLSNFSAPIPGWLIATGFACAILGPVASLVTSTGKLRRDRAAAKTYRQLAADAQSNTEGTTIYQGEALTVAEISRRLGKIQYQGPINNLGVAAAGALVLTGACVAYPPLEPYALFFTGVYGLCSFGGYLSTEREAVKDFVRRAPQQVWWNLWHWNTWQAQRVLQKARRAGTLAAQGGFFKRMATAWRTGRQVIKQESVRKATERARAMDGLSSGKRLAFRAHEWVTATKTWLQFFRANSRKQLVNGNGNGNGNGHAKRVSNE